MHTMILEPTEPGVATFRIHHNGDFSGSVVVINDRTSQKMEIPADVLLRFTAEYIRDKRLSKFEDVDWETLLNDRV